MGVKNPSEISAAFAKHFNGRDKQGLLKLYAADAVFTLDGTAIARGTAEIEKAMTPFFEGPLKTNATCGACHEAGDIALVRTDWTLVAPDGSTAAAGSSAEVLKKSADGLWRFAIDDATYASRMR